MSSADDRLDVIQGIYEDALDNEAQDLADASTPALVSAIQANLATARANYYAAVEASLDSSAAAVESAYASAQLALTEVKAARSAAELITSLLSKLNTATKAGASLIDAAKSV